jgi:heptosyltransferase-2
MIMAQTAFKLMRAREPALAIDVLAPAWSHPLLARMPEIDQAIELDAGHGDLRLLERWRLGRRLRARDYCRAVVLPRSWKSALIPFAAGIAERSGQRGEFRYGLINDIRSFTRDEHRRTAQRFASLVLPRDVDPPHPLPWPALRVDEANRERVTQALQLRPGERPIAGLAPGAEFGSSKRWPYERYREVAARLIERGFAIWVFGSEKDRAAGESVRPASVGSAFQNLCGRTRLEDVVDLVSLTRGMIANDSGLMHLAAATGRRVVGIFGSTSPEHTPARGPSVRLLHAGVDCSPCFRRECPLAHHDCMQQIGVDAVIAALLAD